MEIYIDVLFFTNFLTDYILLCVTAEIMSTKTSRIRKIFSAAFGAAASVCFFVFDFNAAGIFSVFLAALMCAAVFCPCGIGELFKSTVTFFFCSAAVCGIIYADMRLFGGGIVKNGICYANSPRITVIFSLFYLFSKTFLSKIKHRISKEIPSVTLEYNGKKITCKGFFDTGNGLFDPTNRKPVILAEEKVLEKLTSLRSEKALTFGKNERIRIIPYKTVDSEGCFTALVIDRIYVNGKCYEKPVVASCPKKLKYPVILHSGM